MPVYPLLTCEPWIRERCQMGDDILSHMGCRVTDMKVVPCLDLYACSSASSLVLHRYYLCPIERIIPRTSFRLGWITQSTLWTHYRKNVLCRDPIFLPRAKTRALGKENVCRERLSANTSRRQLTGLPWACLSAVNSSRRSGPFCRELRSAKNARRQNGPLS